MIKICFPFKLLQYTSSRNVLISVHKFSIVSSTDCFLGLISRFFLLSTLAWILKPKN